MVKWLIIVSIVLSMLLIGAAAFLSPADFIKEDNTQDWCTMMENKPNNQWQGDDFERFAKECL